MEPISAIGLLAARLLLGLGFAAHGAQKLFGWFGGGGPQATGGYFGSLGFRAPTAMAVLAGLGEFGGGLLTALGLFWPLGPALMISVMVVAMLVVHIGHGFFATGNGVELPAAYSAGALALTFAGPGPLALDPLLGISLAAPAGAAMILLAGVVAGLLVAWGGRVTADHVPTLR